MSVLFDPFLDQQRAYQFEVNGYGVQGDSPRERRRQHRVLAVERQLVGHAGRRRIESGRQRQRHEQLGTVRHPRRPVLGRAVRHRRPGRRGRLDGRDADPVQEPALSVAGGRTGSPLGLPDHPHHPRQVGGAVVVADLAGRGRPAHAVRRGRRPVRSVPEPQPGVPAGADRLPVRRPRHEHRRLRQRRPERRAGARRQVRHHAQPDRRHHLQPRLLPDRVGPPRRSKRISGSSSSTRSSGRSSSKDRRSSRPRRRSPWSTRARSPTPASAAS